MELNIISFSTNSLQNNAVADRWKERMEGRIKQAEKIAFTEKSSFTKADKQFQNVFLKSESEIEAVRCCQ